MSSRSPARDLRASDNDRDRVLAVLSAAHSDGRLTQEEFSQRMSLAVAAKTLGDLAGLTADLAEAPLVRLEDPRVISAVFGSVRRDGRWVVPDTLAVTAIRGTAEVDFRAAILRTSHVKVAVTAVVGKVFLIVPDGIRVDVSGRALLSLDGLGRRSMGQNTVPVTDPDQPVLDVHALVLGGKLTVRTPPRPRRLRLFTRRA